MSFARSTVCDFLEEEGMAFHALCRMMLVKDSARSLLCNIRDVARKKDLNTSKQSQNIRPFSKSLGPLTQQNTESTLADFINDKSCLFLF